MDMEKKKVLVVGAGKSGLGAVRLLDAAGACVTLYDGNRDLNKETIRKQTGTLELACAFGALPEDLGRFDLCVVSPGVPLDAPDMIRIKEEGVPIWGEIELASRETSADILAITGTNGKTTTTSLLYAILKEAGKTAFALGNIGTPFTLGAMEAKAGDVIAAEISSFQLETAQTFHPKISAILNITPDHLNRHHTMEEYTQVKERITMHQARPDICVLNYEDDVLRKFGEEISDHICVRYFSRKTRLPKGMYLAGEDIFLDGKKVLSASELAILGDHNMENVMAACLMADGYGIPLETILNACRKFEGVEHRIEFVGEIDGVTYYNDSKGTNPDAAIKAIKAMQRPTLLIGGGYDKGNTYEEWIDAFDGKVRKFLLVGQTKDDIKAAALKKGFPEKDIVLFETFSDAVRYAGTEARAGEAVLLSPACASWGMFKNYEERGRIFKELVRSL